MKAFHRSRISLVCAAAALSFGGLAAAQDNAKQASQPSTPGVTSVKPDYTKSMERLQQSAQRLREAIQAMAQKKPGPDRDYAIQQAQQALSETQSAMVSLPPELRSKGTVSSADYDRSVQELMKAADRLRQSIQAMAQQPAGDRRNQAIFDANRALWDTQEAMVSAYDPGHKSRNSSTGSSAASTSGEASKNSSRDAHSASK